MTWGWIVANVEERGQKTEGCGSGVALHGHLAFVFCPLSFVLPSRFSRPSGMSARQAHVLRLGTISALQQAQGDYTMKKMIEKIVDAILELVAGSFEIDPCNLKDEDLVTGASRLGAAAG